MHRRCASEAVDGGPGSLLRRFVLAASLAALSLAANVAPAAGAVTIGQLQPFHGVPEADVCTFNDVDVVQTTVTSGNTYVVPATGTLTSWSHNVFLRAGGGQQLTVKIFRKVADPDRYQVVGHDGPRVLIPRTVNTFATNIQVKPGDLLGLNLLSPTGTGCVFTASPADRILGRMPGLADGASGEFPLVEAGLRLNVSAVVVPSNSFTVGKGKLNKRKGTATLTVTVPNPGELTGAGKGVKVANAAVTSKAVTAPGAVKLTIRAKGKQKKKLNEAGKVKVKPKITYTPTGGDPSSQSIKVKLKKKL